MYINFADKVRIKSCQKPLDVIIEEYYNKYMTQYPDGYFMLKTSDAKDVIHKSYAHAFAGPDHFSFVSGKMWHEFGFILHYDSGFGCLAYFLRTAFNTIRDFPINEITYEDYLFSSCDTKKGYALKKATLIKILYYKCLRIEVKAVLFRKALSISKKINGNFKTYLSLAYAIIIKFTLYPFGIKKIISPINKHFLKPFVIRPLIGIFKIFFHHDIKIYPVKGDDFYILRDSHYDKMIKKNFNKIFKA